jgi:hypothetical protein
VKMAAAIAPPDDICGERDRILAFPEDDELHRKTLGRHLRELAGLRIALSDLRDVVAVLSGFEQLGGPHAAAALPAGARCSARFDRTGA